MKTLSIIVPSYNTSQFIDDCIPTFLVDSCLEDMEILIIDDGSNDDTYEKALRYEDKYPKTVHVIRKENGGHGSAINRGIIEATGKYFKVIDGDDWIISENLIGFITFLKSISVDVVINPHIMHDINTNRETISDETHKPYSTAIMIDTIYKNVRIGIHNVTYATKILKDNAITFYENCYYEDQQYDVFPMVYTNTIAFYKEPIYVYRVGSKNQSINVKVNQKNRRMSEKIIDSLIEYANNLPNKLTKERRDYLMIDIARRVNNRCSFYLKLPFGRASKKELHSFFEYYKAKAPELYNCPTSFHVKLLRLDNWISYTCIYVLFFLKRKKRGF